MTRLTKVVSRIADIGGILRRPLVVMIEPEGTIAFREKGRRTVYRTTLESAYCLAVKQYALAAKKEQVAAKKARKLAKAA